jgi:diguanylate cyclase (GGDEF)-like protein/PAS domain S-box-containing protein
MSLTAALIYWIIVALWLAVLATVGVAFLRNPRTFGTIRLLLIVLVIDTVRNIAENLYFGLYFGGQYGLFPAAIVGVLGNPNYLIIPKVLNVLAACAVLGLLLFRWLPQASREHSQVETALQTSTEALHQEIEERRRLFETSLDLIIVTDRKGVFIRVSPSAKVTIGYEPQEMIGRSGDDFILPEDLDRTRHEMKQARDGRHVRNFETRYVHKDGHVVPLAWSGVWSEPERKHFFIGRDMTERKTAEERLWQLAHCDPLTGLPNRTSLYEDLDKLLNGRPGRAAAIALFDLDGFKDINAALGHSIGDRLLRQVAQRLTTAAQGTRFYRLGGDEFVLVLSGDDPPAAMQEVSALLQQLGEWFEIDEHRLFVAASAGIAIAPADGATADALLASADLALYDAKSAGGRTCRQFVPSLRTKAAARRELDAELRRACAKDEFVLHYQPQLRSSDAALTGAEALLRWHHPSKGVLAPGTFIEALSQSAAAAEVGKWILMTACQTAASWRGKGLPALRIAVNLFPAQFTSGTLVADVEEALRASGLPPEALELEITENIALDHDETVLAPLNQLRAMGIGIAFDDFGTGFASLSYLTRYPLTRIKIDRSFVQRISEGAGTQETAIVRSIIAMASSLGLSVTAEGVETAAQSNFLRAEGCDELQGFLFSKPLPAVCFESFLASYSAPDEQQKTSATRLLAQSS